jgi:predicted nucleic acid-binding protein
MYLLDTNVASELRKAGGSRIDPQVANWIASVPEGTTFLSAITVLEVERGVLRIERRDPAQGAILRDWAQSELLKAFAGRILPVDEAVALRCAPLHVPDPRSERDALIAATALVHGLTVVTRNVRDFDSTGVPLLNPWEWGQ